MFGCAPKYELRLPERLELPTLDEVRASSQGNTIGQVSSMPHPLMLPISPKHPTLVSTLPPSQAPVMTATAMHIHHPSPLSPSQHLTQLSTTVPSFHPQLSPAPALQQHITSPTPYPLVSQLSPLSSFSPTVRPNSPDWLKYFALSSPSPYTSPTLQYLNLHYSGLQQQQSHVLPSIPINYIETNSPVFQQWDPLYPVSNLKNFNSNNQNYYQDHSTFNRLQLNKPLNVFD